MGTEGEIQRQAEREKQKRAKREYIDGQRENEDRRRSDTETGRVEMKAGGEGIRKWAELTFDRGETIR